MSDPDPIPMADLTPPARPKRPDMEVNIVLLGDAGIGKSQLLRFVHSLLTLQSTHTHTHTYIYTRLFYSSLSYAYSRGNRSRWTNESVQMVRRHSSSLSFRLARLTCPTQDGYTPSTHDEYSIEVKVDGLRVLARFHDAGSARPDGVPHPLQYVWAKGVIICYDINDKESFKNTAVVSLAPRRRACLRVGCGFADTVSLQHKTTSTLHEYAPVLVLAGLKKDLRREGPGLALTGFLEQPKQVTAEEVMSPPPPAAILLFLLVGYTC